jgi:uncharacterized YigZ family protein
VIDFYKTISAPSEGIYKEKGSKFLAFTFPVDNHEDVKLIVQKFKKDYFDARHICYAYMLGADRNEYRTVDDGEPSGTAGRPILGQINAAQLTNILVVVVRYFGGVLLGTGGLTHAYKEATTDAIKNAKLIQKSIEVNVSLSFSFINLNEVMKVIKETGAKIIHQQLDNECQIEVRISKSKESIFMSKLEKFEPIIL